MVVNGHIGSKRWVSTSQENVQIVNRSSGFFFFTFQEGVEEFDVILNKCMLAPSLIPACVQRLSTRKASVCISADMNILLPSFY